MTENRLDNSSQYRKRINWKTWIGNNFEIEYPSSWRAETKDKYLYFKPPDFFIYPDGKTFITLPIVSMSIHERETEWLASQSLEDMIDEFLRFKVKGFRGFKLIKKSYYKVISGEKGALLTYDYVIGSFIERRHVRAVQGVLPKDKRLYDISGEARKEKFPQYETDFVDLIKSLRILGKVKI